MQSWTSACLNQLINHNNDNDYIQRQKADMQTVFAGQAEPSAKLRTELLQKASLEYQASGDLGPLQPDTPQNSVRSLLNALLLKQLPNQVLKPLPELAVSCSK